MKAPTPNKAQGDQKEEGTADNSSTCYLDDDALLEEQDRRQVGDSRKDGRVIEQTSGVGDYKKVSGSDVPFSAETTATRAEREGQAGRINQDRGGTEARTKRRLKMTTVTEPRRRKEATPRREGPGT